MKPKKARKASKSAFSMPDHIYIVLPSINYSDGSSLEKQRRLQQRAKPKTMTATMKTTTTRSTCWQTPCTRTSMIPPPLYIKVPGVKAVQAAVDKAIDSLPEHVRQHARKIVASIRDTSRNEDLRYCYSVDVCQEKFNAVVDKLLIEVEGKPLQTDIARHVETIKTATVGLWNWGTTEEEPGPIMNTNNMSWSVQRGREMGLDDSTVSLASKLCLQTHFDTSVSDFATRLCVQALQ